MNTSDGSEIARARDLCLQAAAIADRIGLGRLQIILEMALNEIARWQEAESEPAKPESRADD